jgi:hypothetical protein
MTPEMKRKGNGTEINAVCIQVSVHLNGFVVVILRFNLLNPTGYRMHQQVEYFNSCMLCPYRIFVFCVCLRTNQDLCHLHKTLIGFYNRDEKCLRRGTDWAF